MRKRKPELQSGTWQSQRAYAFQWTVNKYIMRSRKDHGFHRITEWFELAGAFKGHLVHFLNTSKLKRNQKREPLLLKVYGVYLAGPILWISIIFMERITESTQQMLANILDVIQYLYAEAKRTKWSVMLNKTWKHKTEELG